MGFQKLLRWLLSVSLVVCCYAAPRTHSPDSDLFLPRETPLMNRYVRLDLNNQYGALRLEVLELKFADPPVCILWEKSGLANKTLFEPICNCTTIINNAYYIMELTNYSIEMLTQPLWSDGWWRASWVNPTTNVPNTITWEVVTHQPPVLRPLYFHEEHRRPSISLDCQRLDNPNNKYYAYMEIKSYSSLIQWNVLSRVEEQPSHILLSVQRGYSCPAKVEIRCCSPTPSQPVCGEWRKLWLSDHVSRQEVAGHRVCPTQHEGSAPPKKHPLPKVNNGQCDDAAIDAAVAISPYMKYYPYCPGSTANITNPAGLTNDWRYDNVKYGIEWPVTETDRRHIEGPNNRSVIIKEVTPQDSTIYTTYTTLENDPTDVVMGYYFLTVEPFLRVSIEMHQLDPASMLLKCVPSLKYRYQEVTYTWEFSHKIASYEDWGNYLLIRPDCWEGKHLSFDFAVKCHVSTKIWFSSSDWFSAHMIRYPSKYSLQACARKDRMPYEPPITENPQLIKTEL